MTTLAIAGFRSALSRQYDLSRREPDIQVVDVDLRGDRCLVLAHYVHDGVLLAEKSCRAVLRHARALGLRGQATRNRCRDGQNPEDLRGGAAWITRAARPSERPPAANSRWR